MLQPYLKRLTGQRLLLGLVGLMVVLQLRLVAVEERRRLVQQLSQQTTTTTTSTTNNNPSTHNPNVFFVRTANSSASAEIEWFNARKRNETILVASANAAAASSPIANNLLCSLQKNAPLSLSSLIVWATDLAAATHLSRLSVESYNSSFGVYHDATLNLPPGKADYNHNPEGFFKLMEARNAFFVHLLGTVRTHFIFTDTDVVFLSDPFEDLNVPWGIPDSTLDTALKLHGDSLDVIAGDADGNALMNDVIRSVPDVVYSTDSRDFYHNLYDPYEGNPRIPPICGGFFFARANPRTLALWQYIHQQDLNDQWGMDQLLNGKLANWRNNYHHSAAVQQQQQASARRWDAVIVDPLPAGIQQRKDTRMSVGNVQSVVRVRVLSQAAYRAALPHYADGGKLGADNDVFLEELKERGEKEVILHPNYCSKMIDWFHPYPFKFKKGWPIIFVFNDNKQDILQKLGKWYLNKDGHCDSLLTLDER